MRTTRLITPRQLRTGFLVKIRIMPRTTERSRLLDELERVQVDLVAGLAMQILAADATAAVIHQDSTDDDSASSSETEPVYLFRRMILSVLGELGTMRERVEAMRYIAEWRVWRGLKLDRRSVLEWYFTMDERWFKAQVRPRSLFHQRQMR